MKGIRLLLGVGLLFSLGGPAGGRAAEGEPGHRGAASLENALRALRRDHGGVLGLSVLTRSFEGRAVWLAEASLADRDSRGQLPALLILAGAEGTDLAGTEIALDFLRSLCEGADGGWKSLLETRVVYVIPRLNPDAAEAYFTEPRVETETNRAAFDEDNDGDSGEDGPDDLNGDGLVSWMRVRDPEGAMIPHPDEPRVMIEADAAKGETGRWLYMREGIDNDGDGAVNEDPPGGVNFNMNFPFGYPWHKPGAGSNPLFENETRALADFVVNHPHIGAAFVFSSHSTLLDKPASESPSGGRSPQTKIHEDDVRYYEFFGGEFRKALNIGSAVKTDPVPGAVADWLYFHRGLFSVSAPAWSPDIALALKKSGDGENGEEADKADKTDDADEDAENGDEKESGKPEGEKDKPDERAKTERGYVKWLEEHNPGGFIEWTPVEHPDFPGRDAEVGGFAPYSKKLPPPDVLEAMKPGYAAFFKILLERMPSIAIHHTEVERPGGDVYRLRVTVENEGYLPTVLEHGERTREILPTRVELTPQEGVSLLAGEAMTRIGPLAGGGGRELEYVLSAPQGGAVEIEAVSALAGTARRIIELGGNGGEE